MHVYWTAHTHSYRDDLDIDLNGIQMNRVWDIKVCSLHLLMGGPILATATTVPPMTTRPPTTVPHGCFYENKWHPEGEIDRDENNCWGVVCEGGGIMHWDGKCFLEGQPSCPGGWLEEVPGQCCHICHTTPTTIPTTTPRVPENGCLYNDTVYRNYDQFDVSKDGCTAKECHYGIVQTWSMSCPDPSRCTDDQFDVSKDGCTAKECHYGIVQTWSMSCPDPRRCTGTVVTVKGQCCPECQVTTTPNVPKDGCLYNGIVYNNSILHVSEDGCEITECRNGEVQTWTMSCPDPNPCAGSIVTHTGYCCPVCMPPEGGCFIDGKVYRYNEVYNATDPCKPCSCLPGGSTGCADVSCEVTSDCENLYREDGQCCFTCGSSGIPASTILILLATLVLKAL